MSGTNLILRDLKSLEYIHELMKLREEARVNMNKSRARMSMSEPGSSDYRENLKIFMDAKKQETGFSEAITFVGSDIQNCDLRVLIQSWI